MAKKTTQWVKVIQHLKKYGHITSWEAISKYRITRLSAIIPVLREKGYDISSYRVDEWDDDTGEYKGHYAKYYLEGDKDGE